MKRIRFWHLLVFGVLVLLVIVLLPFLYMSGSRLFEQVTIPADGYEIAGYFSPGTNSNGPWVIFGHGNRQEGQDHVLYQSLLRNVRSEAAVLAIDFRGFGQSSAEGLERADNIWDRSGDFDAAVSYLQANYQVPDDQIVLMGHSLGAAQALRAAHDRQYRRVIPIGLGDYDRVLSNPDQMRDYSEKFASNTGVALEPEVMLREGQKFVPASLFTPCPETPVTLVFGEHDDSNSVLYSAEKVPTQCDPPIRWYIIAQADHMYGTEGRDYPEVIQKLYSTTTLSLLTWRVNRLLDE